MYDSPNQCLSNSILSRYSCAHDEFKCNLRRIYPGTGPPTTRVLINSNHHQTETAFQQRRTSSGTASSGMMVPVRKR